MATQNQIDHILVNNILKGRVFVTPYYNFVSNHKCIVARIGINGNQLKKDVLLNIKSPLDTFMKRGIMTNSKKSYQVKLDEEVKKGTGKEKIKTTEKINLSSLDGKNWLTSDEIN